MPDRRAEGPLPGRLARPDHARRDPRRGAARPGSCRRTARTGSAPALRFYNTVSTARDMDQLRQAVGDDVMNYLGFSYGTELGWTYAHLFPRQVHTFVLDGAVDPTQIHKENSTVQLQGFESAFGQFAAWCRHAPACTQLPDPAAAVRPGVRERRSTRRCATGTARAAHRIPRRHRRASRRCTREVPGRSWPPRSPRRRAATGPGCCNSPTGTTSGRPTGPTRTSSTRTPRSAATTPRSANHRRSARSCAARKALARRFPLFGSDGRRRAGLPGLATAPHPGAAGRPRRPRSRFWSSATCTIPATPYRGAVQPDQGARQRAAC